ncbi:MAG: helix-turn-helix transcriptional regulator [Candidatus Latescibacteria bacterium]|nr:helix-turn-helix transcriptional regulator [Candidatus Latescibacterota bacterium]
MAANIVDLPPDFPERLRALREQRYMTQSDLAARAEVATRSVHELESGRRSRALAKTIMLLAEALEVSYAELVTGQPTSPAELTDATPDQVDDQESVTVQEVAADTPPTVPTPVTAVVARRPHYVRTVLITLLILLGAAGLALTLFDGRRVVVNESEGIVEVTGKMLGRSIWRRDFSNEIRVWRHAPWDKDVLLLGLAAQHTNGGRLLAVTADKGRTLWEVEPDRNDLALAFDQQYVYSGAYHCRDILDADLDGDGRREVVVHFMHNKWFPSVILVVDHDGRVESQYANRGHVCDLHIADLNTDGKDEVICAGTNNAPEYHGATIFILDDEHRSGAAIDPVTSPGYAAVDASLVRLVFPIWPETVQEALGTHDRLAGFEARTFQRSDGSVGIQANIGYQDDDYFSVDFDAHLHPTFMSISDKLQTKLAHAGTGDHAWDRAWLDGHLRFESGRMAAVTPLP